MFFDTALLCYKSQGKFSIIWVSATRGVGYLKRKEILGVDVSKTSEEITTLILSDSTNRYNRISLSLSAKLVSGLIRIHQKQVVILYDEILKLLSTVHFTPETKPAIKRRDDISSDEEETTTKKPKKKRVSKDAQIPLSGSPIVKERTRRKHEIVLTPQDETVYQLLELTENIPLLGPPEIIQIQTFAARGLASEADLDKIEILPPEGTPKSKRPAEELRRKRQLLPEIGRKDQFERVSLEQISVLPEQHTVRSLDRQVGLEHEVPIGVLPDIERLPSALDQDIQQVPQVVPTVPAPVGEKEKHEESRVLPKVFAKPAVPKVAVNKLLLKLGRRKVTNINLPRDEAEEIISADRRKSTMSNPLVTKANLANSIYFLTPKTAQQVRAGRSTMSTIRPSFESVRVAFPDESTPELIPAQQIVAQPFPQRSTLSGALAPPLETMDTIIEEQNHGERIAVELPLPSDPTMPPAKKPRPAEVTTEISEMLPELTFEQPQEELVRGAQQRKKPQQRKEPVMPIEIIFIQRHILKIIENWDYSVKDLEIDDVCSEPHTKYRIAVTFYALLELAKSGYVTLDTKFESIELGCIKKGWKPLPK